MKITLDPWQQEIINYEGNILLGKGRRIGATHLFARKAVDHIFKTPNPHPTSQIVCVSITEEQAQLMIAFATNYAREKYPEVIGEGTNKPTLNRLILVVDDNRRILLARPVGMSGDSIRGFEGQVLMVDEASKMPPLFWASARPILATTGGKIWMWSTFFGTAEYFYGQYDKIYNLKEPNPRYKVWMKTTEEVFANREICDTWTAKQREDSLKFLKDEEADMTRLVYAQEYLAIASNNLRQLFPDELLEKIMTLSRRGEIRPHRAYFLGQDIADMGKDTSTWEILDGTNRKFIEQIENITKKRIRCPERVDTTLDLERQYRFNKIGIDDGGPGSGDFGYLLSSASTRRKTLALNNSSRDLNRDGTKKKKLLKEDMYQNLLAMMEHGEIKLLKEDDIYRSLRSVQFETVDRKTKYFGSDTHIAEGLIRAAWLAKDKSLKLFISY